LYRYTGLKKYFLLAIDSSVRFGILLASEADPSVTGGVS